MAGKEKFTAEQVANALRETKGMTTLTARKLGCDWKTVQRYVRTYATVAEVLKEEREKTGDQVELTLANMALGKANSRGDYEREPNVAALIFLAKTKYRDRGYVEKLTLEGNLQIDIINRTVKALEEAGLDAADVFEDLIQDAARLKQDAGTAGAATAGGETAAID